MQTEIYIAGFDDSYASAIAGLMDIFNQAGRFAADGGHEAAGKSISVKLASITGKPIHCQNKIKINADCSLEEIQRADVFIVPSVHEVEKNTSKFRRLIDLLPELDKAGTTLASICTGAFVLAETGLLQGKEATTHWSVADLFRQRYPKVRLKPAKLVANHGGPYCSSDSHASADMAYCLLEKHLGPALAAKTARFFAHDFKHGPRSWFRTDHGDEQILAVQRWIERHLDAPISIAEISRFAGISRRSLERRFKMAVGVSALEYVQHLKVETAKQLLETTNRSFDEIAYALGYLNSGSFRKVFVGRVNLLPSQYRKRFGA